MRFLVGPSRRQVSAIVGTVGLVSALAACGGSEGGTEAGDSECGSVSMDLGHVFPADSAIGQAAEQLAGEVAEGTGGQITINPFPDGQLGGEEEMATSLSGGSLHASILSVGATGFGDRVLLGTLPYLVDTYEEADQLFYGDGFVAEWDTETLQENGIVGLGFFEGGFRGLSNSDHPVQLPEDVAGLTVRAPSSEMVISVLEAWDAKPVAIPFPELYTGLDQGTVDGQENGVSLVYDASLYEVQDYYTDTRHMYTTLALGVAQGAWDDLCVEQQDVLRSAAEAASLAQREANRSGVNEQLNELKELINVYVPTEDEYDVWRESVQDIYDEYAIDKFGPEVVDDLLEASDTARG